MPKPNLSLVGADHPDFDLVKEEPVPTQSDVLAAVTGLAAGIITEDEARSSVGLPPDGTPFGTASMDSDTAARLAADAAEPTPVAAAVQQAVARQTRRSARASGVVAVKDEPGSKPAAKAKPDPKRKPQGGKTPGAAKPAGGRVRAQAAAPAAKPAKGPKPENVALLVGYLEASGKPTERLSAAAKLVKGHTPRQARHAVWMAGLMPAQKTQPVQAVTVALRAAVENTTGKKWSVLAKNAEIGKK